MSPRHIFSGLTACALTLASLGVSAQEQGAVVATPHVSARLVASAQAVAPGDTVTVGLAKTIIPGWHTYWRNPGDSGLATTIDWQTPEGAAVGDIEWPAPERHSLGPVTNYGYEGEVTLLSPLTVPADAAPGMTIALRAAVSWLVCADICIPEDVELELTLPVAQATRGDGHPAIDAARARLPQPSPWAARHAVGEDGLWLAVDAGALPEGARDIWFYPYDWGRIDQSAPQALSRTADGIVLAAPRGQAPPADAPLAGVLVIREDTADGLLTTAFEVSAPRVDAIAPGEPVARDDGGAAPSIGLGMALLFALAGGLILNLMPCVFPVLAMKVLALVRSGGDAAGVRGHGLAYLAGVLASFALLAAVVLALQQGGARLGWGFQFQSPVFVVMVAWLLFAVGLNLSGVFTLGGGRLAGIGQSLTARGGHSGSFFTGVLAAVVATPCTAPFMGAAIGFAMTQPPASLVAIFLALGLGLPLPFVVLAWRPALVARLPRPGAWMERFKQFLAFPMYGAAVWLVWVLALQAGADGVLVAAGGMLAIALAAWLYDATWASAARLRRGAQATAAMLVVATLAVGSGLATQPRETQAAARAGALLAHEPYAPERFDALRAEGRAVFVNMTAAWCITCIVNEQVALERADVAAAFAERDIAYLKGDWTNQDAAITAVLERFGRSGVPLYLYYPPGAGSEAVVLPQILTPDIVLDAIGV
ncbi:protein-disulfide reductase DsbD family protein [Pseudazoarcus pumilus]|uniref:Thiol:disulfide interchange protein n=1 Tax=Pseudazoarcus pumilus TaxID=2067960 RepID=A0A2I6S821_9RHOO|nr:protein-disulfide reductase DsbD domain-containing protein [Pseudazoarcus pumilus]AUN95392.1 thiol:disulfide interchange protein [Pseudazoarcus pumilus]